MPGGTKEKAFAHENTKYLTTEQAQYDYVQLIKQVRKDYGGEDRAVIVFGGSYGGMLAAWLRMKFPATFQGAHAASAPILFYPGSVSPYGFNAVVTNDFAKYDANCPVFIR
jgi:lysosomal Pro-X carboxypeptidase